MLTPYRTVLATPGVRGFVLIGLVARIPMAMISLGQVLLVRSTTGSYALAGAVTALAQLGNAVLGPAVGRQLDRRGQAVVLPPLLAGHGIGMVALIVLAERHAPHWTLFASALAGGACYPALGFLVRARWSHAVSGESVQVAFALESTLDEICFVVGPPLVTVLATGIHPAAGIGTAVAVTVLAGTAFALLQGSQPPPTGITGRGQGSVLHLRGMVVLVGVALALAMFFGSFEVTAVAFAGGHGGRAYAGPVLAGLSLGSGISGLLTGTRSWRLGQPDRMWRGAALLTLALLPTPFVGSVWLMTVVSLLAGLSIAPTLICVFGLAEALMPAEQLSEVFALLSTATMLGLAAGTAASGALIDGPGVPWSYAFGAGATLLAGVIAGAGRSRLTPASSGRRTRGATRPAPAGRL